MRLFTVIAVILCLSFSLQAEDNPPAVDKTLKLYPDRLQTLGSERASVSQPKKTAVAKPVRPLTFQPVTAVRIKKPVPIKLERIRPIVPAQTPVKPQGPDPAATLDLSDVIEDAALLEDLGDVCGWDGHLILQDSAAAHVFYYIPREFLLKRDPEGYRLSVQYNTRAETGQPSVMITAELKAPHRIGDVGLLRSILRRALDLEPADPLDVKALPGLGAAADFHALATGLSLPADRIHLNPPAYLKQAFRLTLSLTQDETEEVLAQIAGDGLVGNLNVKVDDTVIPIPIRLQYQRFSGLQLKGFEGWIEGRAIATLENVTDFPIRIEAVNAYRIKNGELVRISKQLKPISIDPASARSFNMPAAKALLGDHLAVAWMGLSMDGSCSDCISRIDSTVRKGVALSPGSRIQLEAIPAVFEEFGLYKLIIHVQTPYFTAKGKSVQQQEVALTAEQNKNEDLQIFVPSDKGTEPLLFKYRIEAVTETGENRIAPEWHDSRKLTQYFGAAQVEGLFHQAE
ncbi:MAG: hypothetical protein R6U50_13175 [Desulfobacterales bacterium]